ncbi:MAG: hypothetical protein M3R51_00170 [Candidatus Eremiobacteraeota bacterium]|nr:hypothetical protein [Candidatus Eremiobacteraeota bacterium]
MSDSFRTTPPEQQWSGSSTSGNGYQSSTPPNDAQSQNDLGRALLVGLLGGLASAAGYFVYRRLPDEQRDRINNQVRSQVQAKISEIRSNFNV